MLPDPGCRAAVVNALLTAAGAFFALSSRVDFYNDMGGTLTGFVQEKEDNAWHNIKGEFLSVPAEKAAFLSFL